MINWKVRIKNPQFWLTVIPACLLLAQCIATALGVEFNLTEIQSKAVAIINAVFAILTALGIVNDPTTAGLHDSHLAMTYDEPKDDSRSN